MRRQSSDGSAACAQRQATQMVLQRVALFHCRVHTHPAAPFSQALEARYRQTGQHHRRENAGKEYPSWQDGGGRCITCSSRITSTASMHSTARHTAALSSGWHQGSLHTQQARTITAAVSQSARKRAKQSKSQRALCVCVNVTRCVAGCDATMSTQQEGARCCCSHVLANAACKMCAYTRRLNPCASGAAHATPRAAQRRCQSGMQNSKTRLPSLRSSKPGGGRCSKICLLPGCCHNAWTLFAYMQSLLIRWPRTCTGPAHPSQHRPQCCCTWIGLPACSRALLRSCSLLAAPLTAPCAPCLRPPPLQAQQAPQAAPRLLPALPAGGPWRR